MCALSDCSPEKARTGRQHHYMPGVFRNEHKINKACAHYEQNDCNRARRSGAEQPGRAAHTLLTVITRK